MYLAMSFLLDHLEIVVFIQGKFELGGQLDQRSPFFPLKRSPAPLSAM